MSINPDIKKAIEIIDQRIESLKKIKENLAAEFGIDVKLQPSRSPVAPEAGPHQLSLTGTGGTSKDKVAAFLRNHNPASRKEIVKGTGLPDGTVSYALNDKERFRRTDNGWVNVSLDELRFGETSDDPAHDARDNKTEAVRQFFREQGPRGALPSDLGDYLQRSGITQNRNYAYSAIARLKKQAEIKRRNHRYYATEKLIPSSTGNEVVQ